MRLMCSILSAVGLGSWAFALTPEQIEQRVALSAPTAEERKLDQIGWARDIRTALKLAQEHQRPVFLFTHDGRMAAGRC